MGGDFQYISDKQSFDELLSEGQGKKDVVLCFVKGLGMKGEKMNSPYALNTFKDEVFDNLVKH